MKLKICLVVIFMIFLVAGNAKAQMPEEIWREYQFLDPFSPELRRMYSLFDEPYYSLALKRLAETKILSDSQQLSFLLSEMINRLPYDYDNLFREFWNHLSLTATQSDLLNILVNYKIDNLPTNLNWFIDDVVDAFWREETDSYAIRNVACNGPKRYQQMFLEKFLALNPFSHELVLAIIFCDENKELLLTKLLIHPDLTKEDLLGVLFLINGYPVLYDQYFSLLMIRQNELTVDELSFIENTCRVDSYCLFFAQLKFSATLQRKKELLEIMRKKQ